MNKRFVLLTCLFASLAAAFIQVNPDLRQIVDDKGRSRLFHGVNSVFKTAPYYPITDHWDPELSLCELDMQNLTKWGFNVMRLGVMWPAVSPVRGTIDTAYLAKMRKITDDLGAHGVYTIVDCHQDLFNRLFCGEGAPDWAVIVPNKTKVFPKPKFDETVPYTDGVPDLSYCLSHQFVDFYSTGAVGAAFESFYKNKNGILDEFAKYWAAVANAFKDSPYVLGYEILNEPWAGDTVNRPQLLLPTFADTDNLEPMYEKVAAAIREVDPDHIIMFERSITNILGTTGFATWGPGGQKYGNRNVYSFHNYCGSIDRDGNPTSAFLCKFEQWAQYEQDMLSGAVLKLPSFLTEFGAVGGNSSASIEMLNWSGSTADDTLQSWAYWQFKPYNDFTTMSTDAESLFYSNGELQAKKVDALSRAYAQAVAGKILSMGYKPDEKRFTLTYTINTTINAPTEIYLPASLRSGFSVSLYPTNAATWAVSTDGYRLLITATAAAKHGTKMAVGVSPGTHVAIPSFVAQNTTDYAQDWGDFNPLADSSAMGLAPLLSLLAALLYALF